MKRKWRSAGFLLPLAVMCLSLDLILTSVMVSDADRMDQIWGHGERSIVTVGGEQVDAQPYYTQKYASRKSAASAGRKVSERISDEGIVLLKNDGLLPLAASQRITPLGLHFFLPHYGGTGSSAISTAKNAVVTPLEGLQSVFSDVNEQAVSRQSQAAQNSDQWVTVLPISPLAQENAALSELTLSSLCTAQECAQSTALVMLGRQTGEGADAWQGEYTDGTPHMLALTQAEHALIDWAAEVCGSVIVVLTSASAMQIPELADDPRINAILWIGGAGSTGYASLARVLVGDVCPSGRLPVTFAADFTADPTYANLDDGSDRFVYDQVTSTALTSKTVEEQAAVAFHEYEEGIYIGYRYWETAKQMEGISGQVVYPFGYGLSYTTFSQEIVRWHVNGDDVFCTVRVTNVGECAGKEVVQLYVQVPYTPLDAVYGIEKSVISLAAFGKTNLLEPGKAEVLTLSFSLKDIASYCAGMDLGSGDLGGYMLEEGLYTVSIRSSVEEALDSVELRLNERRIFKMDEASYMLSDAQSFAETGANWASYLAASDHFELMQRYADGELSGMVTLSRASWNETKPTAPVEADRMASDAVHAAIAENDLDAPALLSSEEEAVYPMSCADNGLVLADLRGKSPKDSLWLELMNQLDYADSDAFERALLTAGYQTEAMDAVGLPASAQYDGPQGLTMADVNGNNTLRDKCGYPTEVMLAASWNTELAMAMGEAVAQEALTDAINGWYAPGLNVVRTPFCGRNAEYFSEDPFLSGMMGAALISAAETGGLSCAIKHLGPMETEAHHSTSTCNWMTEQTLREIYLRSFQIALTSAQMTVRFIDEGEQMQQTVLQAGSFIMVSDGAIGALWPAVCDSLLTKVVREEWGFEGAIVTDMHSALLTGLPERLLQSGCDLLMTTSRSAQFSDAFMQSADGQNLLRRAVQHLCIMQVNTNLMQGMQPSTVVSYGLSPWQKGLICMNLITGVAVIAVLVVLIGQKMQAKQVK